MSSETLAGPATGVTGGAAAALAFFGMVVARGMCAKGCVQSTLGRCATLPKEHNASTCSYGEAGAAGAAAAAAGEAPLEDAVPGAEAPGFGEPWGSATIKGTAGSVANSAL